MFLVTKFLTNMCLCVPVQAVQGEASSGWTQGNPHAGYPRRPHHSVSWPHHQGQRHHPAGHFHVQDHGQHPLRLRYPPTSGTLSAWLARRSKAFEMWLNKNKIWCVFWRMGLPLVSTNRKTMVCWVIKITFWFSQTTLLFIAVIKMASWLV